jgi:5-formyltetrahydrofolate cyclo-ligase
VRGKEGGAEAKREVRARMRAVRARIAADADERARRSASIVEAVAAKIAERARPSDRPLRVLLFDPLPGEPDVGPLAAWCAERGIDTFLPEVDGEALLVTPGAIDPPALDVVVVPGLAFTEGGDRLGHGGGHFDRFLPRLRPDCLVVGVAFHEQLVAELPTADHDARVDVVVTA